MLQRRLIWPIKVVTLHCYGKSDISLEQITSQAVHSCCYLGRKYISRGAQPFRHRGSQNPDNQGSRNSDMFLPRLQHFRQLKNATFFGQNWHFCRIIWYNLFLPWLVSTWLPYARSSWNYRLLGVTQSSKNQQRGNKCLHFSLKPVHQLRVSPVWASSSIESSPS